MNILYIITSGNKGIGGHYYSLTTIVEELKKMKINPIVICIGKSPIIDNGNYIKYFYPINKKISKINIDIKNLVIKHDIKLIHLFDFFSFRYIMGIKIPHIQTKCGGKYNKFIPNSKYMTVFSKENLFDFRKRKKFDNTIIKFIPNRIKKFTFDNDRIEILKKKIEYNSTNKYILRICRISKEYQKSIKQGYNLFLKLNELNFNTKFVVIGSVSDISLYNKLKIECPKIIWLTDSKFTYNAKQLIDFCDIYVGTGRGVMEASICKKLIMVPTNNKMLPVLLNKLNFNSLFNLNFSQRLNMEIKEEKILHPIIECLNNDKENFKLYKFYEEMFDKYFNVETSSEKYISFYNQVIDKYNSKIITLNVFNSIIYKFYFKYILIRYTHK